ncbi:MAG TPA: CoA transferase, partial [Ramlibacter sp.]
GLLQDPRFTTNGGRAANRAALVEAMTAVLLTRDTEHWVAAFEAAGVPAGPVKSMMQVLEDPQVLARDMVVEVEHPVAGTVKALGCPIKFGNGGGVTRRGAPVYGEHTAEVLAEIGYSEQEIGDLVRSGAVHVPHSK